MNALDMIAVAMLAEGRNYEVNAEAVAPTTPIDIADVFAHMRSEDAPIGVIQRADYIQAAAQQIDIKSNTATNVFFQPAVSGRGGIRLRPFTEFLQSCGLVSPVTFDWGPHTILPNSWRSGDWRLIVGFEKNTEYGRMGRMYVLRMRGARTKYAAVLDNLAKWADNVVGRDGKTQADRRAWRLVSAPTSAPDEEPHTDLHDDTSSEQARLEDLVKHMRTNYGRVRASVAL